MRELATIQRIDPARLHGMLTRDDIVLVDVREPSEVELGAIDGGLAIPLGYLMRRLAEVPRDRTIAVYCLSGMRSPIAASLLGVAGYSRVVDRAKHR